jgi:outer membrane protein insertion porin family
MRLFSVRLAALALFFAALPAAAQIPSIDGGENSRVEILGLTVSGTESESTQGVVLQASGLSVGQQLRLPGDLALADAVRDIYRLNQFTNVRIVEEQRAASGVFLRIEVEEAPRLRDYTFEGVRRGWKGDLRKRIPLIKGTRISDTDLRRTELAVSSFYREKGLPLAEVEARTEPAEAGGLNVVVEVEPGPKVRVGEVIVEGNEQISDRTLRKQLESTRPAAWWQFWGGAKKFDADKFADDLDALVRYYRERGYYDAYVERDTAYVAFNEEGKPETVVEVEVNEGERYFVRDLEWDGNTVYTDLALSNALGLREGDVFNAVRYEENLYGNADMNDVSSLYQNLGHLRFNVQPSVRVVAPDSVDLYFDLYEGEVYDFGAIRIAGNDKTKEHVIRRELYTVPGQPFSRESIIESIRRLSQLNYFNAETLQRGPDPIPNDETQTVDLVYTVEEVGGDQLELSGTWGGIGLILQLRVTFNNFSAQNLFKREAWDPLPMGDGQSLSLAVQTNGLAYQNYSVSFTEPWFRGKPTPIGFSTSFTRIDYNSLGRSTFDALSDSTEQEARVLTTFNGRAFYQQRLKFPDDKFQYSTGVGYRYYNVPGGLSTLPGGVFHEVTLDQTLMRNSQDHPIFPRRGSLFEASLSIAPPIPGTVQYHKWGLKNVWNAPFTERITLGVVSQYGYIGSFTDDPVQFERYLLGGSPFEAQGVNQQIGSDIIYMRGYPFASLGPTRNGRATGGRILNRYSAELRLLAVQSPQLQAAPYLFFDAANTWDSFDTYNPAQLYRSAGVGARLFLPILGMIEFAYGWNLDEYPATRSDTGLREGRFQFTIGQGFNQ